MKDVIKTEYMQLLEEHIPVCPDPEKKREYEQILNKRRRDAERYADSISDREHLEHGDALVITEKQEKAIDWLLRFYKHNIKAYESKLDYPKYSDSDKRIPVKQLPKSGSPLCAASCRDKNELQMGEECQACPFATVFTSWKHNESPCDKLAIFTNCNGHAWPAADFDYKHSITWARVAIERLESWKERKVWKMEQYRDSTNGGGFESELASVVNKNK